MLWLHRDQPERAAEFLIRHRPDHPADLRVWRQILTSVRLRMGDLQGAQSLFDSLNSDGSDRDEDWILLRSTLDLASANPMSVIYRLDDARSAIANFSDRGQSRAAVLLGEAHLMAGDPAPALDALIRARTLAESWEARMEEARPNFGTGAAVLGEWLGMHALVLEAKALCALGRELEAAVLIERAHGFHWREAARADRLADTSGSDSLGAKDLQAWAATYELGLITWISGANDALAIHVKQDGTAAHFGIGLPRRDLSRGIRRYRDAILRGDAARHQKIGRELSAAILPPSLLAEMDREAGAPGNLLLLSHGELERLPFAALPFGDAVLDEVAVLRILPELPTRRPGAPLAGKREWAFLGDPVDPSGFQRLPGAGAELDELQRLNPAALRLTGSEFTKTAVLDVLETGRSLHFATHLYAMDDCASPRFSAMGLELSSDESLCASSVASLASQTDLVVLATCASAAGRHLDGRGIQGMARAFLDGGARNLLVTLWPIRDDVAARFSEMYHRLLADGAGPALAARGARRALAEEGVEPVDWASFRALGRD